jgi:hypothetical protein
LVAVPLLGIQIRGLVRDICSPELHRQVVEAWEVIAGDRIFASPPVLEGGRTAAVIKLLEAVVEPYAHAAVDTEVVVGFISSATGRGHGGGIGRRLVAWTEVRVHHAGEIQAKVIAAALRVSMEALPIPRKAVAGVEMAVHGGARQQPPRDRPRLEGADWTRCGHDKSGCAQLRE